ncbi:MAG: CapA family protein [bacterium]|nr:CapA family protein [bacterium]
MKKLPILALILIPASFIFLLLLKVTGTNTPLITSQNKKSIFNLTFQNNDFKPQSLTLEKIFQDDHLWTATLSAGKKITMLATGDVMPGRTVNIESLKRQNFTWPYEKTAKSLKEADFTLINLETPLIKNCPPTAVGMVFCADERNIEGLIFAGVDLVNLANNHTYNFGQKGLQKTIDFLNNAGIQPVGVSGPSYKEIKGVKFSFLGYNAMEKIDEEKLKNEIQEAGKNSGVVIVSFHWGAEYTNQPNNYQKYLAHLAIDSGADLIIGNHPHWVQPIEIYKDKLITYSHGNFIFDQPWSQKTKEGVIGKYTFYGNDLIDTEFLPIQINNLAQPNLIEDPKQKQRILEEMKK